MLLLLLLLQIEVELGSCWPVLFDVLAFRALAPAPWLGDADVKRAFVSELALWSEIKIPWQDFFPH